MGILNKNCKHEEMVFVGYNDDEETQAVYQCKKALCMHQEIRKALTAK